MTMNVWSLSADHQRRRWRCSQRSYLWLRSALTSGRLLMSLANQKPPCWDLRWNATSHKTSAAASLSFTPHTAAINWRIWDTIVVDRGHLKYWRCVWFMILVENGGLSRPLLLIIIKNKCCTHYKVIYFCSGIWGKGDTWKYVMIRIFQCS